MTEIVIPLEWQEAINQTPHCMTLRGALADWYREQQDEVAAEALDWTITKGRSPHKYLEDYKWHADDDGYGGYSVLPAPLCIKKPGNWQGVSTPYDALVRLIGKWRNSTPGERAEYWKWEPNQ